MAAELWDILDFLEQVPAFRHLDESTRAALPRQMQVAYLRRDTLLQEAEHDGLWLLRVGAAEIRTTDGRLVDRVGEGGLLQPAAADREALEILLIEDSLFYHLPGAALHRLQQRPPDWPAETTPTACHHPEPHQEEASAPLQVTLSSLALPEALRCRDDHTVGEVAQLMRDQDRDTVLLETADGNVHGILTDRDLRNRVLAAGLDPVRTPVRTIMSQPVVQIEAQATVITALDTMGRAGIHHLAVADHAGRIRWLFADDLLADLLGDAGINAIKRLQRANDLPTLASAWHQAPHPLDQPETIPVHARLAQYNRRLRLLLAQARFLHGLPETDEPSAWPDPELARNEHLPGLPLRRPDDLPAALNDWLQAQGVMFADETRAVAGVDRPTLLGFFRDTVIDADGAAQPEIDLQQQIVEPIRRVVAARTPTPTDPPPSMASATTARLEQLAREPDLAHAARDLTRALDRAWLLQMHQVRATGQSRPVPVVELTAPDRYLLRQGLVALRQWQSDD